MKIAYFTYPSAFQNVGGGEIQLLKTKEYVEKKGVKIDLFDMWKHRVEDYDILHVFSSVKDCLALAEVAKKRDVKVVVSPVLWSDLRRAFFTEGGFRAKSELLARHLLKAALPSFPSSRRRLLAAADLLFPNSEAEKKQISRLFAIPKEKMRVVHNGVDEGFLRADGRFFQEKYGKEPFILSVGRIEPRKNQLNLIKAAKKLKNRRLVLIGSPVSGYEGYFDACRKEGEGFAEFLPTLGHGDPLLGSAYAACELFVLQGWFETPGLAALEAALAGARLVVTRGGSTREYFEDHVEYLDPASPEDIAGGIERAAKLPKDGRLRERVLKSFTWDKIADKYVSIYHELSKDG